MPIGGLAQFTDDTLTAVVIQLVEILACNEKVGSSSLSDGSSLSARQNVVVEGVWERR